MKYVDSYGLPPAVLRALVNDPYVRKADISTTTLIKPVQMVALERRYEDRLRAEAMDSVWALFGQSVHKILERGINDGVLIEQSFFYTHKGWILSGTVDIIEDSILDDYKVTSAWAILNGVKDEWKKQLNVNRFLAMRNGLLIDRLRIVAILRDWTKLQATRHQNFSNQQLVVLEVEPLPLNLVEAYVHQRMREHQKAVELEPSELPECNSQERWQRPDQWAIHKLKKDGEPLQSAYRVLEDEDKAYELAEEMNDKGKARYRVIARPGESVRCKKYCAVAPFCSQYKSMEGGSDESPPKASGDPQISGLSQEGQQERVSKVHVREQ